jgi:membrane protease YdiL (CAAX protease family)
MASEVTGPGDKPLWRKIVDFPLVAMLIALFLLYAGVRVSAAIAQDLPLIAGFDPLMQFDAVCGLMFVILHRLLIRHLGDPKRDDLRLPGSLRPLGLGLLGGFVVFSLVVVVGSLLGVYRIVGEGDATGLPHALIASAIFPAISEEMVVRGVLFRWIEQFGGSWIALILTAVFFGAIHLGNPNASWAGAIGIAFEAGVMLGAAYMLTRSLWLPMGIHAAWNFAQGEVFDIPVSGTPVHGMVDARLQGPPLLTGNGFGLEASLIAMVVATLFGLWLLRLAMRKGELKQPMWVRRQLANVPT